MYRGRPSSNAAGSLLAGPSRLGDFGITGVPVGFEKHPNLCFCLFAYAYHPHLHMHTNWVAPFHPTCSTYIYTYLPNFGGYAK